MTPPRRREEPSRRSTGLAPRPSPRPAELRSRRRRRQAARGAGRCRPGRRAGDPMPSFRLTGRAGSARRAWPAAAPAGHAGPGPQLRRVPRPAGWPGVTRPGGPPPTQPSPGRADPRPSRSPRRAACLRARRDAGGAGQPASPAQQRRAAAAARQPAAAGQCGRGSPAARRPGHPGQRAAQRRAHQQHQVQHERAEQPRRRRRRRAARADRGQVTSGSDRAHPGSGDQQPPRPRPPPPRTPIGTQAGSSRCRPPARRRSRPGRTPARTGRSGGWRAAPRPGEPGAEAAQHAFHRAAGQPERHDHDQHQIGRAPPGRRSLFSTVSWTGARAAAATADASAAHVSRPLLGRRAGVGRSGLAPRRRAVSP